VDLTQQFVRVGGDDREATQRLCFLVLHPDDEMRLRRRNVESRLEVLLLIGRRGELLSNALRVVVGEREAPTHSPEMLAPGDTGCPALALRN
jgi:hypothetical protein